MFIARLFLKSSTYTHKIAINCPGWLAKKLDKFSVWLTYKAVNSQLASEGKRIAFNPPRSICSCRARKCGKAA